MNQSDIISEMKVLPSIDVDFELRRRVDFIKHQLELSGCKTLVLGISGGVDSCTCGRLAQLAVDELNMVQDGYRFVAVRLPRTPVDVFPDLTAPTVTVITDGFVLAADALRHLVTDPLLPEALAPDRWPAAELRHAYAAYSARYQASLRAFFRSQLAPVAHDSP